jgi:hypothetical protein
MMLYGYGPIRFVCLGQQKWPFFEDDDTILIIWWCFVVTINLGVHLFSTLRNPNITWDVGVFSCIDEILHKFWMAGYLSQSLMFAVEVFPTVDVRIGIVEMAQWVFKPIFGSGYPDKVLYMCTWSSWVVSYFICLPTKCHIVFISLYSLYLCCCLPVGVYMDQSLEKKKTRIHWTEVQIARKSTVNPLS